jgi:hypothetical protein
MASQTVKNALLSFFQVRTPSKQVLLFHAVQNITPVKGVPSPDTLRHISIGCNTMPRVSRRNPVRDGTHDGNEEPPKSTSRTAKKGHSPQQSVPQQRALLLPKHAQCQPNQQIPRVTKLLEHLIREGSRLCPPPQQGIAPEVEAPPRIWVSKIGPLLNCYIVLGRPHPKQGPLATM